MLPLVWPVAVVMPRVLGQDFPEMLLAEDQHAVEELPGQGADEPLADCVGHAVDCTRSR